MGDAREQLGGGGQRGDVGAQHAVHERLAKLRRNAVAEGRARSLLHHTENDPCECPERQHRGRLEAACERPIEQRRTSPREAKRGACDEHPDQGRTDHGVLMRTQQTREFSQRTVTRGGHECSR